MTKKVIYFMIDVDDIKVTWSAGAKDYGVTGKHS